MPVYLCKPGWASSEPWRHGVQVYAYPFYIDENSNNTNGNRNHHGAGYQQHQIHHPQASDSSGGAGAAAAARNQAGGGIMVPAAAEHWPADDAAAAANHPTPPNPPGEEDTVIASNRSSPADVVAAAAAAAGVPVTSHHIQPSSSSTILSPTTGVAVRRVRHAEVVLVDEVSIAYGRYWLRLRWPGAQGGFAGYIALGTVKKVTPPPPHPAHQGGAVILRERTGGSEGSGGGGEEEGEMDEVAVANATRAVIEEAEVERRGRTLSRSQLSEVSDNPPTRPNSPPDGGGGGEGEGETPEQPKAYFAPTAAGPNNANATTAEDDNNSKAAGGGSPSTDDVAQTPPSSDNDHDHDHDHDDDGNNETSSQSSQTNTSSPSSSLHHRIKCESTGLYFPSSTAMELLAMYDDGLTLHSTTNDNGGGGGGGGDCVAEEGGGSGALGLVTSRSSSNFLGGHVENSGEPVFCRICREGLHDVNYDLDPVTGGAKQQLESVVWPPPPPPPPPPALAPPRNRNAVAPMEAAAAGMDAGGRPLGAGRHNNTEGLRHRAVGFQGREQPEGMEEERVGGVVDNAAAAGVGGGEHYTDGRDAAPRHTQEMMLQQQHHQSAAAAAAAAASALITHHPTAENPLLAPCECSGSMAFVHYLCVEQWRCRSRHPAARNGLNCETCGSEYTLPPPPSRPSSRRSGEGADGAGAGVFADEDWLEAMPAHVLAALRRPHPWWQLGAAIVRRRWLRPIAPIIMSPVVALYCRARRTLKKRGVSRRRWACSLCRRRARWKCVRCLRSYYCSRQCQNVSWHIVHKHVCYKPARFWWSVVVYGVGAALAFPGILRDPLIYDLGLSFVPASFLIMGIIGGGIATALKKSFGVDIRGRVLEVIVVLCTIWLAMISWGLVWAFFGMSDQCWGVFGQWSEDYVSDENVGFGSKVVSPALHVMRRVLFNPARVWFSMCNRAAAKTGPLARWICSAENFASEDSMGCFQTAGNANPDFFLPEHSGEKCAADLVTVALFWGAAGAVLVAGSIVKRRERDRRAAGRAGGRGRAGRHHGEPRPHQD